MVMNIKFIVTFLSMTGAGLWLLMIACGFYCVLHGWSLWFWLKKHKYERWRDLSTAETSTGTIGPGMNNVKKWTEYIESELDNEIEEVLRHKDAYGVGKRYMGIFFLASLVAFGIVVALIFLVNH